MKVMYVCHRVPFPPKRGGKIRPFNMIRHLTDSGHQVTVASLARSAAERDEARGLDAHCSKSMVEIISDGSAWARMIANVASLRPSSFAYFHSPRLAERIRVELSANQYDLIFVHCSSVAPYVADVTAATKVLDYGDMDSQKWREYATHRSFPMSVAYWLEAEKLERVELQLSRKFDLATCTTRAELESLRGLGATGLSDWFPNGVDSDFFKPTSQPYNPRQIAFVGRMDYYPNQQAVNWFCSQVWPALRQCIPELQFLVVGAEPSAQIRSLAQLPGVTVTGSVPDVRPYVQQAALTVAPLTIARGTQNKILESMAMATPVVCSPAAVGGVDAVAGEHLLVASRVQEWVDAIRSILGSSERRTLLGAAARARVLSHHSWAASMHRLDMLLGAVVQQKRLH